MNTQQALRASLDMSLHVLNTYLQDLSDDDLMLRPAAGCNHLAWQLGHLISSEVSLLESVCPGKGATLPEGFAARHSKETAQDDDRSHFCSRAEYQELFARVRAATLAALEQITPEALDEPSPEWIRSHFPTVGHMFTLIGSHPMMHAGQFVVVRRLLGKPILI